MKILKKVLIILVIVFIAGCSNKEINQTYDNMQAGSGKNDINGYSIDLRIYGTVDKQTVNEIVRISNFNDEDYKITIVNKDINPLVNEEDDNVTIENNDTIIYVLDGKKYIDEDGQYIETNEKQKYTNPLVYLEGLNNVKSVEDESEEVNGENKYQVYDVKIKESYVKDILDEIDQDITVSDDIDAKIYINEEGYLYRVIYYIGSLTVNVNYYGINNSAEIVLP